MKSEKPMGNNIRDTMFIVHYSDHMFLSKLHSFITFPSISEISNLKVLNLQIYSKINDRSEGLCEV